MAGTDGYTVEFGDGDLRQLPENEEVYGRVSEYSNAQNLGSS